MFKTTWNRRETLFGLAGAVFAPLPASANELPLGIIFVGASWCAVCHRTAPVLKSISSQLDIKVLVASADDLPIPPFEQHVSAVGHPLTQNIRSYPNTLIYSSIEDDVLGIVSGFRNQKWYSENLMTALQLAQRGKRFKAGSER